MRLGELLVQAGLLSREQVEQALRGQVMWGGRLGTNVVELRFLDLDTLSRVIARQHGLPAAFATHFEAADLAVQRRLSPELAGRYACVPLRRVGSDRIAIASIAPLHGRARALVAEGLGVSPKALVPAIAAELRIHYHLERIYGIERDLRFLRSRKASKLPPVEVDPEDPEDPDAVATLAFERAGDAIPEALLPQFTPRISTEPREKTDRRRYLQTLGDTTTEVGRIELVRQVSSAQPPAKGPATLEDATRAIRAATDRDAIAQQVIDAIMRFVPAPAATLLVVRGDAATSSADDLAVPLDEPNLVVSALNDLALVRSPPTNAIDAVLVQMLGMPHGELVIAPIKIGVHVWALIAFAAEPETTLDPVAPIANAAAMALARLLRNANR